MTSAVVPGTDGDEPGGGRLGRAGSGRADQSWAWNLSRASAILLAILVPVHFAFTFLVDDVGRTTARSISERLDDPVWRLLTWLLVALALVHATIAAGRALLARPGRGGLVAVVAVSAVAAATLAAATWVLATRFV